MKRADALKRKKDFRYTYRTGKSVPDRWFVCISTHSRLEGTRVGISVSKKQGNAVQRNRIKRRLREAVTPYIPRFVSHKNIIFVARHGVIDAPFEELGHAVETVLKKAGLLKQDAQVSD